MILSIEWKQQLYFLADITKHLSDINVKLQGKEKYIWDLARYTLKLNAFKNQINEHDYTFFPTLTARENDEEVIEALGYRSEDFIQLIDILVEEFNSRFSDFKQFDLSFKFFKNPFIFDEKNLQELSDILRTKKSHLEFDISLINEENHLPNETSGALWNRLLSNCDFMVLKNVVPKFLCMFGSTYVCESTFPSLTRRKNKFRTALSQHNLESEIRCEVSKLNLNINKLAELKENHPSHGHPSQCKN